MARCWKPHQPTPPTTPNTRSVLTNPPPLLSRWTMDRTAGREVLTYRSRVGAVHTGAGGGVNGTGLLTGGANAWFHNACRLAKSGCIESLTPQVYCLTPF